VINTMTYVFEDAEMSDENPTGILSNSERFTQVIRRMGGFQIDVYQGLSESVKCVCFDGHICYPIPYDVISGMPMCTHCVTRI
jgi:hypothetical protein